MKKIDKIPKSNYTGYIWYSDAKKPQLFYGTESEFSFDDTKNPFVVEGWLTDNITSYQIKYVDGKHEIFSYDMAELKLLKHEGHKFMPVFKDFKKMHFNQYWRPVADDMCEGMQVLQPAEFVFVGFTK